MRQQDQVTLHVREMILTGQLAPGQRVQEAAIAEQLGISRTPVRQALPALAQEGLLVPAGRRGYSVRVFSINEIVTALDIRAALEGMAARLLTERGVPHALLRKLNVCLGDGDDIFAKPQFEKSDEFSYGQVNERFHNSIVEAADNSVISEFVQKLHRIPFIQPALIAFHNKTRIEMRQQLHYAHQQHHAIADALANGQGARAEALFIEHVNCQRQSMNLSTHRPGMQVSKLPISLQHMSVDSAESD
jgi:GntR family transcriptional regulator, vanillate catabolism transcriptional regulator